MPFSLGMLYQSCVFASNGVEILSSASDGKSVVVCLSCKVVALKRWKLAETPFAAASASAQVFLGRHVFQTSPRTQLFFRHATRKSNEEYY